MTLDLVTWNPEPEGLPPRTLAHIYVGEHGESSPDHRYLKGKTLIMYECASYGELEGVVEMLKQELDAILQKGRRAFSQRNG